MCYFIITMEKDSIWKQVLDKIRIKVSPQTYETWFAETKLLNLDKGVGEIGCKNRYIAHALEERYYNLLRSCLGDILKREVDLSFKVKPELAVQKKPSEFKGGKNEVPMLIPSAGFVDVDFSDKLKRCCLNQKYTFENFVVGSSNRLAHAAALAVSENPGRAYNPLFIYGGVGLGKTHLLQAIGNKALTLNPQLHVLYINTEQLLNELYEGIRKQTMKEFREKYRKLDIFLLDDVQFISGKEALQEEFFNTFNTLYNAGKQMVITSDRPPGEISRLEERVRSRLAGGLVADITMPDFEMRVAILQKKLENETVALPEAVIMVIAECVKYNIRELEGALNTILMYVKTTGKMVTVEEARRLLQRSRRDLRKVISPGDILNIVSEYFGVSVEDIKGKKRTADIAFARQVAMYILREFLNLPLIKIASVVRRQDHTTVLHAIRKIENSVRRDSTLRSKIDEIRTLILQKSEKGNVSVFY